MWLEPLTIISVKCNFCEQDCNKIELAVLGNIKEGKKTVGQYFSPSSCNKIIVMGGKYDEDYQDFKEERKNERKLQK